MGTQVSFLYDFISFHGFVVRVLADIIFTNVAVFRLN